MLGSQNTDQATAYRVTIAPRDVQRGERRTTTSTTRRFSQWRSSTSPRTTRTSNQTMVPNNLKTRRAANQRNDLIDPKRTDKLGRSSLERMQKGNAPIGPDGEPMNLHHLLQTNDGPLAETTKTQHQTYAKTLHINPNTLPSGIDRRQFDAWRRRYWIHRSNDFGG